LDSINQIDEELIKGTDLHGKPFVTGFLGVNNLKANDYENVVLLLLSHIIPMRNIFLQTDFRTSNNLLVRNFGSFMRKLWNPKPFKAGLNPHELLHAIRVGSNDRFDPAKKGDPVEVLAWMLNYIDTALKIVNLVPGNLRGKLRSTTVFEEKREQEPEADMMEFYASIGEHVSTKKTVTKQIPFIFLSLDLPPTPLFQNASGKSAIPQVQLLDLFAKYNGIQTVNGMDGSLQSFEIETQPKKYLITVIKRLVKNHNGQLEKNQTVVNFPVRDLQVSSRSEVCKYDLVANVSHLGTSDSGEYAIYLKHRRSGKWFLVHDLKVKEIAPQTIFLTDTYIQLWERTDNTKL
jgi:U4/U6.U5 tri-snRNP-associated protein 2